MTISAHSADAAREAARNHDGTFGVQARAEGSGVDLADQADDPIAALGDLTADQQRLLAIITDPKNDHAGYGYASDPAELALEWEESFGSFEGYDAYGDAQKVADMLYAHYNSGENHRQHGKGDFSFGYESNSEGEIGTYSVGVYLGHDLGYLTQSHDTKYLTADRQATGLRAALAYAESIDGDYQQMLAKAQRLGLLSAGPADDGTDLHAAREALAAWDATPEGEDIDVDTMAGVRDALASYVAAASAPRKSVWPENLTEREAFDDWAREVSDGDTAVSFRQWYEHRTSETDEDVD